MLILENRAYIKGIGVFVGEQELILENRGFGLENRAYIREQGLILENSVYIGEFVTIEGTEFIGGKLLEMSIPDREKS